MSLQPQHVARKGGVPLMWPAHARIVRPPPGTKLSKSNYRFESLMGCLLYAKQGFKCHLHPIPLLKGLIVCEDVSCHARSLMRWDCFMVPQEG
eukprot:5560334-Amphidinium_carterae.1